MRLSLQFRGIRNNCGDEIVSGSLRAKKGEKMGFLGWLFKRRSEPQISFSVEIVETPSKQKSEPAWRRYEGQTFKNYLKRKYPHNGQIPAKKTTSTILM